MTAGDGGSGDERLRLFVAASLPEDLRANVAAAVAPLHPEVPEARWIPAANMHLTLKFLGSTPASALGEVTSVCRTVASRLDPGRVALGGFGAFPSARRARVLWVGVDDETDLLARAAAGLNGGLAPLGYAPEDRAFTAHLTIARLKAPRRVENLPEAARVGEPFEVSTLDLYRSRLSPKGARYELVEAFPLGSSKG